MGNQFGNRKSKLYEETFVPKLLGSFLNWRGVRASTFYDYRPKMPIKYIISGELKNCEEMTKRIKEANEKNEPIKITFVKKYLKRFVNQVAVEKNKKWYENQTNKEE